MAIKRHTPEQIIFKLRGADSSVALDSIDLDEQTREITVPDLVEMYKADVSTARRWCEKGQIEARRIGRDWVLIEKLREGLLLQRRVGQGYRR